MDFDTFGVPLGGSHLHRFEPADGDRLRYIKTPAQANAKWVASTSVGQQTWADNLNNTQKPIVSAAIAQRQTMQANFQAATSAGGVWERNLSAVGDAGIKQAARDKAGNYGQGVQQGSAKQLAAITKIIAYEAAGLPAIYAITGPGSGKTRMNQWFDYMSAGRGQLGA